MLTELSKKLGHNFNNIKLLEEALTHPSSSENLNYERLEFLGDSVLSLVITTLLVDKFQNEKEGDLAKRRASLVNGKSLHKISNIIGLGEYIILSEGEENTGGRSNPKILEDTIEAIIGAIYVDGGLDPCKIFVSKYWNDIIDSDITPPIDNKTFLQEWAQSKGYKLPEYKVLDRTGPDHKPSFSVQVTVGDLTPCIASSHSKKEAEKEAAQLMINYIKEQHEPKS
ncbi:MAG: ribonuclease III [Alphaproteobacteria bacterium]|nr:ribonuclease III [Alphaproteobacteria bacterium]